MVYLCKERKPQRLGKGSEVTGLAQVVIVAEADTKGGTWEGANGVFILWSASFSHPRNAVTEKKEDQVLYNLLTGIPLGDECQYFNLAGVKRCKSCPGVRSSHTTLFLTDLRNLFAGLCLSLIDLSRVATS
jgi:hypothetical protein